MPCFQGAHHLLAIGMPVTLRERVGEGGERRKKQTKHKQEEYICKKYNQQNLMSRIYRFLKTIQ